MSDMNVMMLPLVLIALCFLIVPLVALVVLQVYLSKMEKDWPGLVLPIISGSLTILITLVLLLAAVRGTMYITVIISIVFINLPSIVFTLIYFNVHKKQVPKNEIDKMTIQDLG
jgi:uncharacterized membrane protein HdeD (DUF308 family)